MQYAIAVSTTTAAATLTPRAPPAESNGRATGNGCIDGDEVGENVGKYTIVLHENICVDAFNVKFRVKTPSGSQSLVSVEKIALPLTTVTLSVPTKGVEEVLHPWIRVKFTETDAVMPVVIT